MKKVTFALAVLLVALVVILMLKNNNPSQKSPSSGQNSSPLLGQSFNVIKPITVSGWFACVPPKSENTTCVIGIENIKHSDYVLLDSSGNLVNPISYTTGQKGTISGILVDLNNSKLQKVYNITGAIQLQ